MSPTQRLLIHAQLRRMKWAVRLALLRHRVDYWFYQHTEDALFAAVAAGLIASEAILFAAGR